MVIEVTALIAHRVQYAEAIKYYIDLTPEEETEKTNQLLLFLIPEKEKANKEGLLKKKREIWMNFLNKVTGVRPLQWPDTLHL